MHYEGPQRSAAPILAELLGLGQGDELDATLLEQMTPELVLQLDTIASELLALGRANQVVRALRAALVGPVKPGDVP